MIGTSRQHALRGVSELISEQLDYHFRGQKTNITEDWQLRYSHRNKFVQTTKVMTCLLGASLTGICIGARIPKPTQLYVHSKWFANEQEQREIMVSIITSL